MTITQQQLEKLIPKAKGGVQQWVEALNTTLPAFEINTTNRIAAFIAQCAHESGGFSILEENLNYKATTLTRLWPQRFPVSVVDQYAGHPQAIANKAYGGRMGNGDEATGDGFKYRGRGLIQLTGKDNYKACSLSLFKDDTLLKTPDMLLEPTYALKSACWFWNKNKLNQYADTGDIETMTKKINGGVIGLDDRIKHYKHAIEVLSA